MNICISAYLLKHLFNPFLTFLNTCSIQALPCLGNSSKEDSCPGFQGTGRSAIGHCYAQCPRFCRSSRVRRELGRGRYGFPYLERKGFLSKSHLSYSLIISSQLTGCKEKTFWSCRRHWENFSVDEWYAWRGERQRKDNHERPDKEQLQPKQRRTGF